MRQIARSSSVFLIAAFLFVTSAFAQQDGGNVVNGLDIKVVTKSGEVVATATTRADGSFSFTVKDVGDYYIIADDAELSEARIELAKQGAPVAKKAKKTAKKASLKSAEPAPEADVDIVAALEGNLKYDVKPYGAVMTIRKKADKSSAVLYVSKTNTPVMGKMSWNLKKGQ
jgi:hypothetical protein